MPNVIAIKNMIGAGGISGGATPTVSTAITPITVKGGVLRCIDQATGGIARTTSGWIEDEKYGVVFNPKTTASSGEFDSAVTRTGRLTLKLSTTDITGRAMGSIGLGGKDGEPPASYSVPAMSKYGIPVKPSTTYKIQVYAKTNNVATNAVQFATAQYNAAGTRNATYPNSNRLSGTQDWSLLTTTLTTANDTVFLVIRMDNNIAGNISDAWFDVNSMTLEEVATINNPSASPVKLYPKVTAVTSTDNIDQSQVVAENTNRLGDSNTDWIAQQFTPTKKNLTGFIIRRGTDTGTYTGDVTISIQADSGSTTPSGTDLGTPLVLTNAQWGAITADTDYTVAYPLTLTIGGTYWIVIKSSTADASNYTRVRIQVTGTYSGGVYKNYNGTVWSAAQAADLYFKTLYSKNTTNFTVRTDTETLSVTAPTVEGWANGTVIDTTDGTRTITPLTLAAGDNTVYISSNGSTLADSDTDESLQCTLNGVMVG